jgi:hypothetical protein
MALQVENFLSGRIGNIVFYKRAGKWIARAAAGKVKQSKATKSWSNIFGKASTAGKSLRVLLRDILPDKQDKEMQNDFSGAIARCMKLLEANGMQPLWPIPELGEHDFNKKTGVRERFRVAIKVSKLSDNLLQIYIPSFTPSRSIAAPAHTKRVDVHICTASCKLPGGQSQGSAGYSLPVPYDDQPISEQFIQLSVDCTPGSLLLTGIRMRYILAGEQQVLKDAFTPSSIVDAAFY